jgi:hypothetical protein
LQAYAFDVEGKGCPPMKQGMTALLNKIMQFQILIYTPPATSEYNLKEGNITHHK